MPQFPPSCLHHRFIRTFILFAFITGTCYGQLHWEWRNPLPGACMNSVLYADNRFVATGDGSTIITSSDGTAWLNRYVGLPDLRIESIAYGNAAFVAVGGHTNGGTIVSSPDGEHWTLRRETSGYYPTQVLFADNKFIVISSSESRQGLVESSPDGSSWTADTAPCFRCIAYGNGRFVASTPEGRLFTSDNGRTWRQSPDPLYLKSIAYGNNRFIGVYDDDSCRISADGETWSALKVATTDGNFQSANFCNDRFIITGKSDELYLSADGAAWTRGWAGGNGNLFTSVAYGNGRYVSVGCQNNSRGAIVTSQTGSSWTALSSITQEDLLSVVNAKGMFAAVGRHRTILTSPDGENWIVRMRDSISDRDLYSIASGNNLFLAVGQYGLTAHSSDGVTWDTAYAEGRTALHLNSVICFNGTFVAVGDVGKILTTVDGISWSPSTSGILENLYSVTSGNGHLLACGRDGTVIISTDGVTWTKPYTPATGELDYRSAGFGDSLFIVAGSTGKILTSPDGKTWKSRTVPLVGSVAFINNHFAAFGIQGSFYLSTDGEQWIPDSLYQLNLRGAAYGNNHYVVVGDNGTILTAATDTPSIVTRTCRTLNKPAGISITTSGNRIITKLRNEVNDKGYTVEICTSAGKMMYTGFIFPHASTLTVPAHKFAPGMYVLSISAAKRGKISAPFILFR
jgi:photosystem II stability/assembly factor-like uncharacterized protein